MTKVKIVLDYTGLNFAWQEYGYTYPEGDKITCCWGDFGFEAFVDGKSLFGERSTTVDSLKFIEYEIDNLNGELGAKMEIEFPGYIEEELNSTIFGIPYKDIPQSKQILFGYSYDDPDDPEKFETIMHNVPLDENGMKPCYIFGYVPYDYVTKENVEEFMTMYAKKHFGLGEDLEFEFEWKDEPTKETLDKEWEHHLEEIEHHKKMVAEGKKYTVCFAVPFLKQMYGEENIKPYEERGLHHGEPINGNFREVLLHFEDGSTEMMKIKDDFDNDYFSEPTIEG